MPNHRCDPVGALRTGRPLVATRSPYRVDDFVAAVQRVVSRWGAQLLSQAVAGDLTRLEVRLVAARLHELQRRLPDLTGGEGVLEPTFDGYQPVSGRPPVRQGSSPGQVDPASVGGLGAQRFVTAGHQGR